MKKYHQENRDRLLAQRRDEYETNREKHNEIDRTRWTGERRDRSNAQRKLNGQAARITTPWKSLLKAAQERAIRKKVPFALTDAWARDAWTGRCAVTGIPFALGLKTPGPKTFSPSIDRIVPALGYTPDNCRFVIWAVNAFKYDGTDEDMYLIAEAILKNLPSG